MTGGARARRRLAALLGVGAVALGALAAFDPAPGRAAPQLPASFSGGAVAVGVHEEESPQAGFAVAEPFYGSFADGLSVYGQNGASARASTFYPGPTVSSPGSLICQINCMSVPAYPLSVYTAGNPPTVSQQTSTPIGGPGQPAGGTAAFADATVQTGDPGAAVSTDAAFGSLTSPAPSGSGSSAVGAGVAPAPAGVSHLSGVRTSAFRHRSSARHSAAGGRSAQRGSAARTAATARARAAQAALSARVAAAAAELRQKVAAILHRPLPAVSPHLGGAGPAAAPTSSAVVHVGSATASTSQYFTFSQSGPVLHANAETVLSGVSLLSGAIQIASIDTKSVATSGGTGKPTQTNTVTVSGVTVEGVPATIDDQGVSIQGQGTGSAPLSALNSALQSALAAAGAHVTLIGTTSKPPQALGGQNCGNQQADGVYVQAALNGNALPAVGDTYNLDYTLGSTCAAAQTAGGPAAAGGAPSSAAGPTGGRTHAGGPAPVASGAGSSSSSLTSLPTGGSTATLGSTGAPAPSSGTTAGPAPSSRPTAAVLGQLTSSRFSYLYLSVVLALVALLVGGGTQLRTVGRRPRGPARAAGR